jgi:hypothetical protein
MASKMNTLIAASALALAASAVAAPAAATSLPPPSIFTYTYPTGDTKGLYVSGYGSKISSWTAVYDRSVASAPRLNMDVAMGSELVRDDGFWMVLNAGGNPKGVTNELAILYGDLRNNRITAYRYNGKNSNDSFTIQDNYITSYANPFSFVGDTRFQFSLDVQRINNLPLGNQWRGVQFNEQIGIWYHPFSNISASYASDGRIQSFSAAKGAQTGWFDTSALKTTPSRPPAQVSEPATLALMGFGLMGLGMMRRRKAA